MSAQDGPELSQEELEAYLAQMREAPASEIVAQVLSMLLNAAQVKLGRADARMLLDAVAAVRDQTADRLDQRLVNEVDNALSQLRLAQVEAEGRSGQRPPTAESDERPAEQAPGQQVPSGGQSDAGRSGSDAASKLWIPGRDR